MEHQQRTIADRYEIEQRIGSGGMAEVYLARDRLLGREVAIKLLNRQYAADAAAVERFRREAQAAAALDHPRVVPIYDWGPAGDTYYIAMAYVPGENLKEAIARRGPLPEAEALAIGSQVASALDAAHRQGIIHRDIKPHNILLDPSGGAKVTDFGIARAAGAAQLTETSVVLGTASYFSPEQAGRQGIDHRSDIYSLGIVLYEALTGRAPFGGDSMVAVAMQHLQDPPPPPRQLRPDISPATEAVVLKAIAKDPEERYATAAAMRDALDEVRRGLLAGNADDPTLIAAAAGGTAATTRAMPAAPAAGAVPAGVASAGGRRGAPPRPPRRTRPAGRERSGPLPIWLVPLAAALLLLGLLGALALAVTGDDALDPAPTPPAQETPPAVAADPTPTPTPTPTVTPTPEPSPTPEPTPAPSPTPAPPTPTPVPPTPTPEPPPPTPTPPPPTPTPPPPTPTPAPAPPPATPDDPAQTVVRFYQLVEAGQFDQAAQLWSPRMRANYPPAQNIDGRFANTDQITIQRAETTARDDAAGTATVAIDILELVDGQTRRWVGAWQLVRGPEGWLMDQPNLQQG